MRISAITFGNYNPNAIINNPPYITNHPFYEYMRDNKLDFDNTDLRAFKSVQHKEADKDSFMTGLFTVTLAGVGVAGYAGRNKLKSGWRRLSDSVKSAFHR
ncbi:MAG: hypothetical protein K6A44_01235 [bacterium]|nr:hypothetical protein [bacterium]